MTSLEKALRDFAQFALHHVPVADLPDRHAALNFLFPRAFEPLFAQN